MIFTLAEVLGGAMHFATFDVDDALPARPQRDDRLPQAGAGRAERDATLDDATIERVKDESADGSKAPFVLEAEVVGEDGVVVARTRGDYQIRPFGT